MNSERVIYSILKEISDGNSEQLSEENYQLTLEQYGEIVDDIINEGLIKKASVVRGGYGAPVLYVHIINAKLTIKGREYLERNSALAKAYRGLKEIRDWLK